MTVSSAYSCYLGCISTHTLTWSVTSDFPRLAEWIEHFNSHAHVERDDKTTLKGVAGKDFNSHAHVERDRINLLKINYFVISTHTLTWSVTGAGKTSLMVADFNSHAHVERDADGLGVNCWVLDFNSHAHVERDCSSYSASISRLHFNSHAHVERDQLRTGNHKII